MKNRKLIKYALEEKLNDIPGPPDTKEVTWKMIQKQQITNKIPRRRLNRSVIAAVIFVFLILTLVFIPPKKVAAFSWFNNILLNIQGTITQLMGSTSNTDQPANKPAPDISISFEDVKTHIMSVEEAQKETTFQIIFPTIMPSGYTLKDIALQKRGDNKSSHIIINYTNHEESIVIKQTDITNQSGYSIGLDNEDTLIKKIELNGNEGTLLYFKNNSKRLIWTDDNVQYLIDSNKNISDKQFIDIAISMK